MMKVMENMTQQRILELLTKNGPIAKVQSNGRFGTKADELAVCTALGGTMAEIDAGPYDFIVDGVKIDLKRGNCINFSCYQHKDVGFLLMSNDGTKFKYFEPGELQAKFSPSDFHRTLNKIGRRQIITFKTDRTVRSNKVIEKCWPIVMYNDTIKECNSESQFEAISKFCEDGDENIKRLLERDSINFGDVIIKLSNNYVKIDY